ncbi:hypothetical protein Tco_0935698 [Tanacetum coccineum]
MLSHPFPIKVSWFTSQERLVRTSIVSTIPVPTIYIPTICIGIVHIVSHLRENLWNDHLKLLRNDGSDVGVRAIARVASPGWSHIDKKDKINAR